MQKNKKNFFFSTSFLLRTGLVILTLTILIRPVYYYLTEGFSLKRIEVSIQRDPSLILTSPSPKELERIASITKQPFRYLKKGSQAYAFLSEDGQYILKLFKFHHMHSVAWLSSIPLPGQLAKKRDILVNRREDRIRLTLHSYKIAQEELNDECALIYTQIFPCSSFSLPITIIDPLGRTYSFDLAQYGFALQHRASLVLPALRHWIAKSKIEDAKKALSSLVGLFVSRSKKGIQDIDPDLHKNAGFLNKTAVHIDIGSFLKNNRIALKEKMVPDIQKAFKKLLKWLEVNSPELACFLAEKLENPEEETWTANSTSSVP